MKTWIRPIALATALALASTTAGCGYILHPERRGNSGGTISGAMLVCDLLWLIPGIVPGVVFLIVDFTSGAIYVGGRVAMNGHGDGNVAIKLNDSKQARQLELRIVTASHRVIDTKVATVGPTVHGQVVQLHVGVPTEKVFLQIDDHEHAAVQVPIEIL